MNVWHFLGLWLLLSIPVVVWYGNAALREMEGLDGNEG